MTINFTSNWNRFSLPKLNNSFFLPCILAVSLFLPYSSSAQQQAFTAIGVNTFTPHSSVVELTAEAIGGGGGGGLVRGSSERESGGGGGGAYAKGKVNVTPGTLYNIYVANFGKKERDDNDARHGEASWFNSDTSTDANTVVRAVGGITLMHNDNSDPSGKPGGQASNCVGNIATYSGGDGGTTNDNNYGGGGGGAAGSTSNGGNGGQYTAGVKGTGNLLDNSTPGDGGIGGIDNGNDNGLEGTNYGGGGGGARKSLSGSSSTRNGKRGAQGIVVVTWSQVDSISPALACQGSTVTITGSNFTNVSSISFNDVTASTFVVNGPTEITATVPAGATSGFVVVSTEYGKAQILLDIDGAPTSSSFSAGATSLCAGATDTYTATAIGGVNVLYSILNGGASIDTSTGEVSNVTASFTVRATIANNCGFTTVDRVVVVNQLPQVSLAAFNTYCTNAAAFSLSGGTPSGGSYLVNGATATTVDPAQGAGNYTITYQYTDGAGCVGEDTATLNVSECTNIAEEKIDEIVMYPNPANEFIMLNLTNVFGNTIITIYDMQGKIVDRVTPLSSTTRINTEKYPAGVYRMQATAGSENLSKSFLIAK